MNVKRTRPRGPILGANDEPPGASPPVTRTITKRKRRLVNKSWFFSLSTFINSCGIEFWTHDIGYECSKKEENYKI